jgi:hypothetical protein
MLKIARRDGVWRPLPQGVGDAELWRHPLSDGTDRVKTYPFGELLAHPRHAATNVLIGDGLLKDNAILAVVGPSKSFKSFILNTVATDLIVKRNLFVAHRVVHGRHSKAFEMTKPCRVLLIEQEIGEDDLEDRLSPIYAGLAPAEQSLMRANLFTHSLDHTLQLDTVSGYNQLTEVVASIRPDVLIMDPLIEFHTSNENDTQGMAKVMRTFDKLRETFAPLAIIFSHHEGHAQQNPRIGIDRFRGNTVVGAKVDSALLVTVHNRRQLQLRLDFVLRRGKPLDSLYVSLDDALRAQFLCWYRDPEKKKKLANLEEEGASLLMQ